MNKRQPEARKHKVPIPWRLYLVIGFITLLVVGAMAYILQQTKNISATHDPLLVNVSEIELRVMTAHLWFEEILSGDRSEKIEMVRELLDQAEGGLHVMARKKFHSGEHVRPDAVPGTLEAHDRFHLSHDSHIFQNIKESLVVTNRYLAAQTSGPGTEIDQRADRIFAEFQKGTGEITKKIIDSKANHLAEFRVIQTSLIIVCLVLAVLMAVIVHRFERQRADDFLTVLRAEEALRESEKRYQVLFENAADAIFLIEAEGEKLGDIVDANQAAAQMHGYSVEELLGLNLIRDLYTPDAAEEAPTSAKHIMNGEWIKAEITHRKKDGTVFPVEISSGLLEFKDHKYILAIDRDITERKRIAEYQQRVEQMKLTGEWASGLAQEIRNSLAGIRVSIEVLLEELDISAEDRAIVLKAVDEVKQIDKFLKDLLNFAKTHELQLSDVDINDLLDKIITSFLKHPLFSLTSSSKTNVSKHFDENLPALTADPVKLQRVFLSLLFNAVEAMPDGGTLSIKSIYDETAKAIQIAISDTGKGIDRRMIDDVFKPFFTTKSKRSGLELAIARSVVEQHGGVISVKSDPGKWTTFNVYLPLITSSDKETDAIATRSVDDIL
jgi:PAS domain S-box-containing protein